MLWSQTKQILLVTAIAALVMLTNLGGPRLWDRDETRNGECAREMLQRWDWVVPTFNGALRAHKPVLLYWGIMASYLTLGVSEFAARFPSALCAIGSVICVYRMGRRLFGPQAGVWAGISLATSLMFVVAGRAATPDSLLIFCTTLALTIYVCGTFRPRFDTTPADVPPQLYNIPPSSPPVPREDAEEDTSFFGRGHITRSVMATYFPQHWPTVLAMYTVMGLGVLAKGPVGLVLPTAVIGMFLLIVRLPRNTIEGAGYRAFIAPFDPIHFLKTCWSMRPFTAIFAATAVALPWYWAVGLATDGEFLRTFFFEHNLARATSSMENHGGSILFYPATLLIGFFPWSVFALPLAIDTVLQLRRSDRIHPGYLLAVCWMGVYVILFSLARTKLPSYVTPCYPALALLMGDYIDRWSRQRAAVGGRWLIAGFACLGLVGIGIAAVIPVIAKQYLPGEEWLGLIGLVPIVGCVACIGFVAVRSYFASAGALAMTAVAFAILFFAVGVERVDRHQTNHVLLRAIHARSPHPQVASYRVLEPSWVFYGNFLVHEFIDDKRLPSGHTAAAATQFLTQSPDHFLITTSDKFREISQSLPLGIGVIEQTPYFLHGQQKLVLLGPLTASPGSAPASRVSLPSRNGLR